MNYNKYMESATDSEKLWTATSLGAAAGVTGSYVSRLCRQGKIKGQKFGPAWMIPYEEGRRWLDEHAAESKSQDVALTTEA
ncbi:MAG: hypothetical protein ACP5J4_18005 [Anaerolineae bacterium]